MLGAGGAAKAVAGALARSGLKRFYVANRSSKKADRLLKSLRVRYRQLELEAVSYDESQRLLPFCDWVVQATSVGLKKGDPSPLSLKTAKPSTWVVDLIYHRETAFLKQARIRGLSYLDGIGMLLHQGSLSFERWTGKKAPLRIMRKALLNSLVSH